MNTEVLPSCTAGNVQESNLSGESWHFARERSAADIGMFSQAIWDHYRCPEGFLETVPSGEFSSDEGYFRFGSNATCYGRSCSGIRRSQPESALDDLFCQAIADNGILRLPFDPTEIIDNLRLERYRQSSLTTYENILKRIYYSLRPFTNRPVRQQIQRFRAHNWQELTFPHWPVDTTVENLCEKLLLLSLQAEGVSCVPFVWFWPDGARACLTMTHDVETKAGRDFCAELMDLDDVFGIKASFQIVPEKRYSVSTNLLDSIRNRGFDIGVHDLNHDGRLFDDREEFLRRVQVINRYGREYGTRGFRAGVLYRKPEWYGALDFSFDMSFPNVAHLDPQRGGCCTVMPYFIGNILELPVTTMQDYTLFHLLKERSIDLWKNQIELILQKNGLASFIVHPDYVMNGDTQSAYKQLLVHLRNLRERTKVWFALPAEVDQWWRARSKMSIERNGDSWRIGGEGAERAVLAYAKNDDGKLVYELAATPAAV